MKFQSPRGTRDLLFEKAELFARMEGICAKIFAQNNYALIRTPIFESAELFKRSIGGETDIVEKEMFVFKDRGEREYALRPEGTAPVVRAFIENGLASRGKITRLYYIGPMFRAEKPQAGRYREFWQVGAESFGLSRIDGDIQTIVLLHDLLKRMSDDKFPFSIRINDLGCSECRPKFREAINRFLQQHKDELCEDCRRRMVSNPLRALDCKVDADKLSKAPIPFDYLCSDCRKYFDDVRKKLDTFACPFDFFPRLVRGLDYYTGIVFEVVSDKLGAQNALAAGGRYDQLVESLGGQPTPAVGFAIGLDRVVEALAPPPQSSPAEVGGKRITDSGDDGNISPLPPGGEGQGEGANKVFVVVLGDEAIKVGFNLLDKLHKAGFTAPGLLQYDSLKSQMKYADSIGARWAVILGDNELNKKPPVAMVKDLSKSSQEEAPLEGLVDYLKGRSHD